MTNKKAAVFGLYPSVAQAERAADALAQGHFPHANISMLLPDSPATKHFAHGKQPGSTLGLLADSGALTIPQVGLAIGTGPIMGALASLGVERAAAGLAGAFVGMGVPDYEAKRYEDRVKNGGVVLSVQCETSEELTCADRVLVRTGAWDISSTGETRVRSSAAAVTR
jgi:hypothetical protein